MEIVKAFVSLKDGFTASEELRRELEPVGEVGVRVERGGRLGRDRPHLRAL